MNTEDASRTSKAAATYVTANWVKRRYSISRSTLYAWIAAGHLPAPKRIGPRATRFLLADIENFEANLSSTNQVAATRQSRRGAP